MARARRRAKGGGRKLKQGVPRTNTGAIKRSAQEPLDVLAAKTERLEEALAVEAGTWKRRRTNPSLTIEEARRPEHGSVLDNWLAMSNRFRKKGQPERSLITSEQYEALRSLEEAYRGFLAAIAAKQSRSSSDFSGPGGYDNADPFDTEKERRDMAAEQKFRKARTRIMENVPLGMMAFEAVVVENGDCRDMAGDLRMAANELVRLWRVQKAA